MQNKLTDLNNHLFAELERLGNEDLEGDKLKDELSRSKAITDVAQQVIANGNLILSAHMAAQGVTSRGKEGVVIEVPKLLTE